MALTSIDKTRKDIEDVVSDRTPLYAAVGIGDLAVSALRTATSDLSARASGLRPKALRDHAQASVAARIGAVQADVLAAPGEVKALPGKVQAVVGNAVSSALSTYDELAGRGKTLVDRVRHQDTTVELGHQAKVAVAKAKAASTTTRRSATTTKTAAKSATTTARKSATKTRTATRSATTSARKTASAATKAGVAAAAKVGD